MKNTFSGTNEEINLYLEHICQVGGNAKLQLATVSYVCFVIIHQRRQYALDYFNNVRCRDLIKNKYLMIKERKQPLPFAFFSRLNSNTYGTMAGPEMEATR